MSESRTQGDDSVANDQESQLRKPSSSEVRTALERILASRCFQQAGRASDFLRFVVEQTLAGAGQRLKGYTIGVEVFGRPPDFDAQSDALVRVEAGRLRRRLVEYYAGEGTADPVRIELPRGTYAAEYRFACPDDHAEPAPAPAPLPPVATGTSSWRRLALGSCALLAVALGVIVWQQSQLREANRTLARVDEQQRTEWPRIVVVPFENLSADAALDALAASMTEEIMLRLGELELFVVASQSSWYGPSGEERLDAAAGGGYVLTGSVRGTGEQARIAARLIEAGTGAQLWTAAYDEPLTPHGLPALPERVARDVAAIAAPYGPIFEAELARARRSADAPLLRDCFATYHEYRRRVTPAGYRETLACLETVSAREPGVASVWSGLAMLQIDEYASSFGRTGDEALRSARQATARALAIDKDDFAANLALTRVQYFDGDPAFRDSIERTIALRPSSAQAFLQGAFLLVVTGDTAHGLALAEKGRDLTKAPLGFYHLIYAANYLRERRFDEALASAMKVDSPNWVFAQAVLAAAAAHSGRPDLAHETARRIRSMYPRFEADAPANLQRWHFDGAFYEALVSGLRDAGLVLGGAPGAPSG